MERITTAEAARRLSISQTQVRRQIKAGALRAETETRPQGTRLVILWDTPHDAPTTNHDATSVATTDATLVARLEDEVRWLRERLEHAEAERSELRRMLNLEQQTAAGFRAQLNAPHAGEAPADTTQTPPPTPHDATPQEPVRRAPETPVAPPPWYLPWRRLFRR